ncbi:hypothetical protein EDD98_0217 [Streptomyces sp. PanSC19]|nr:hypothetical protein EDD98_0217 [Streptomyces sp. PanSC19]
MTVGTDSPAQARSTAPHAPGQAGPGGAQHAPEPSGPGGAPEPPGHDAVPGSAEAAGFAGIDPDDLPDGLVIADETGRVVRFNAAAARITAVPADRALGLPSTRRCPWRTSRDAAGGR